MSTSTAPDDAALDTSIVDDAGEPATASGEHVTLVGAIAGAAVSATNRNGYATVMGHVLDAMALTPSAFARRPATVRLSTKDEAVLKDGDERQLGAAGLAIALRGSKLEWRAFLGPHFRKRYDIVVLFDGQQTGML